jgi:Zn-dependent protease
MDGFNLLQRIQFVIPLVLSLTVHEWAHAWSAFRLGDDTAERLGRLTLNPLPHIDPIGTLLLPLLGVPFGWARPVPVNPNRFHRRMPMRTGMMITAAAGPAANVVLAVAATVVLALLIRIDVGLLESHPGLVQLLHVFILLNVVLAIFNLLPIYPLDGSRVADGLMPRRWRPAWEKFVRMSPIALLVVIFMPSLFGFSLLDWPVRQARLLLNHLFVAIAT